MSLRLHAGLRSEASRSLSIVSSTTTCASSLFPGTPSTPGTFVSWPSTLASTGLTAWPTRSTSSGPSTRLTTRPRTSVCRPDCDKHCCSHSQPGSRTGRWQCAGFHHPSFWLICSWESCICFGCTLRLFPNWGRWNTSSTRRATIACITVRVSSHRLSLMTNAASRFQPEIDSTLTRITAAYLYFGTFCSIASNQRIHLILLFTGSCIRSKVTIPSTCSFIAGRAS